MIKPTIGRVVWFRPAGYPEGAQPLAAIVVFVWTDTLVNLVIFDQNGETSHKLSCYLHQGDTEIPSGDYAEWMPYQIGQAKKHEEVK